MNKTELKDGLSHMHDLMKGGKPITDKLVDAWNDVLTDAGITDELFNRTAKHIAQAQPSFPAINEFLIAAKDLRPDEGAGSFGAYDCECYKCGYQYAVKVDATKTPDKQKWFCGHCQTPHTVYKSMTNQLDPNTHPMSKDEVKAAVKRMKAVMEGTVLQKKVTAEPVLDKQTEIRRLKAHLAGIIGGAANGNPNDQATLSKWKEWIIKSDAQAIRDACIEIERKQTDGKANNP